MKPEGSTIPPSPEPGKPLHEPPPRRNTTFKSDVLRLVTGTGLAQVIAVLAAPILTRLYAPEAFGVAALFASLTGLLSVLACMRYELSIMLPDNDCEAANLLGVSLCFSVLIALLTVLIVELGGVQVLQWVRMPELAPYLWLIPITVWISGIFTALNYWNTRTKHFARLSIARVTIALTNASGSLGAGFAGHATGGAMIAASVGGQAVATTVLGGQIWRDNGKFLVQSICWRKMFAGLKRHRQFPIYTTWASLLNTASWQLPVLMLGAFFSPAVVGFYALGFRILQMPMSLIGSAISQVFLQRASEEKVKDTLALLVEELFQRLLIVALLPCMILTMIGRDIFGFVFGENWAEAGLFTQLLAPWACIWFISSPLSSLYYVLEKQKEEFGIQSAIFLTRLASIGIGGLIDEPRVAVLLFSITGIFAYGYLVKIIFTFAQLNIKTVLINSLKVFFISLLYLLPVVVVKAFIEDVGLLLLVSFITITLFFLNKKMALGF